jgi:hypothetical protein
LTFVSQKSVRSNGGPERELHLPIQQGLALHFTPGWEWKFIPDTTLKAVRGQPVAARAGFFGRELNSTPALSKVKPGLQARVE